MLTVHTTFNMVYDKNDKWLSNEKSTTHVTVAHDIQGYIIAV